MAALFQRYQSKAWRNSVSQPREAKKAEGYSLFPEPLMFVVPADAIRAKSLPGTYAKLLQFVGDRAVPPVKGTLQRREYFIFIFLKDKVSSSSELDIKVSSKSSGEGGYNKGVKSVYLNDRHVTYMSGKMTLFDKSSSSLVYIKAIFKPGKEVGFFSRSAKRVGLFASDGT